MIIFGPIRDFIVAYKTAYSARISAKDKIKMMKVQHKKFRQLHELCKRIEKDLGDIYHFCPTNQRQDFIQKTLDFFHYGFDILYKKDGRTTYFGGRDYGWTRRIGDIESHIAFAISDSWTDYSNSRYNEIEQRYNDLLKWIDNELFSEEYKYENLRKKHAKEIEDEEQ